MMNILETKSLNVFYGQVQALQDVSIHMKEAEVVTVIGANGAGKSTLLNAIMGSLPSKAKFTGEVYYCQEIMRLMPIQERVSAGFCLVPEKRELFTSMTVEDNLMLGSFRLADTSLRKSLLEEVYQIFPRLQERRKQEAGTLSGGERQMLALGRALMSKPKLLMLDEPSLGLAPLIIKEIFQIIERLRDNGVSILLVEQNARAALQVADRAYVLEMGEVVLEGKAQELANDKRIVESYLGLGNRTKPYHLV
ncbi:ABC transporter ATP-binding protein [Basilea psittacipulmonis]|uniref:Metal-dependent hydrolase n=1 Tax=Basilea psittacipulmonis DSM 24701 TaxID=1072685 RepID=A0A077DFK7_9BURK|nr:ABC transporter ATP-binding protein [Basilea psittacipulmonis]AIL32956.1 metal-dependent hydrolase [Basilea psittacipulmonis DSM 24701]